MKARMIAGEIFNQLTILEELPDQRVRVQCSCGRIYKVTTAYLARKEAPHKCASCGWDHRRKCKVGDTYDNLTVIGFEKEDGRVKVVCHCVCGSEVRTRSDVLRRNKTNNCGCRPGSLWRGHGDMSLTFYNRAKRNAQARELPFEVSMKHLVDLLHQQNHRCALSGLPIYLSHRIKDPSTASIDRINSNQGYTRGNVQWVHKEVNMMKRNIPQDRFVSLCQCIAHHNKKEHLLEE